MNGPAKTQIGVRLIDISRGGDLSGEKYTNLKITT